MSNLTSLSNEALNIVIAILTDAISHTAGRYSEVVPASSKVLWDMFDEADAEMESRTFASD